LVFISYFRQKQIDTLIFKLKISSNTEKKSPGENNTSEILVSASLFLVFLLVIITGVLSYQRLNRIADTVKSGIRPDRKLLLVKEIYNDLSEAENSVKSYSLTRNEDDMVRFYEITQTTGAKVDELKNLMPEGVKRNADFDTLDDLVEKKFDILDKLLDIQDEFRVQQAMQQVMKSIKKQEGPPPVEVSTDTIVYKDTIVQKDTSGVLKPIEKENFFSRLFKRKNKKQEEIPAIIPEKEPDTTKTVAVPHPDFSLEDISKQFMGVQQEALSKEKGLRQEEWGLFQQDKLVMERIRKLLSTMEGREAANLLIHTKEAENQAGEVKMIIMAFGLAASLLLFLTALVIFLYVRRNNEYKTVLRRARQDAEELARAKELFLANMSHEIRTPMNIISGFLNQILDDKLDPAQLERFRIVKKSSDHLLHLLNDLLDLSKLQASKLELVETNFSPAEVISDLQRSLEPAASSKNLIFKASADPGLPAVVCGDPMRLRQILLNLAGNAIKFTDKGQVSIRSFPGKTTDEKIVIVFEISDTGIGIKESDLEKIFGEFQQGTGMLGRNSEGAGLGLSITRRLVGLLGGEIHVESKPGEGSVFRVEIPFREETGDIEPAAGTGTAGKNKLKGLRLLVVDDEEYNRRLVRAILEKYRCVVMESGNAEEAISLVREQKIDMVLMDIRMPGMKGPEAAGEIKKIAETKGKSIPVIIVSAAISKGDLQKSGQKSIDDFISKPVEEEVLVKAIVRLLSNPLINEKAGYDLTPLKMSSGGNDSFFREMVNLFLRNTDEGLKQLDGLIERKEWDNAADLAHKLSSPCRHLKAIKLYNLLKQIEQNMRSPGQPGSAAELSGLVRHEFEIIRQDIKAKNEL
jgi:signal transduction histidine kinase/HPt (histidine-containing phosphotransfer) domain-containing protein